MQASSTRPAFVRTLRIASILSLGVSLCLAGAGRANAAGQAMFAQSNIYLTAEPQPVSVLVQDVAAMRGFELTLTYDGDHMAVTAVGAGGLISAVRPDAQVRVVAAKPGSLTVALDLEAGADPTATTEGETASSALPAPQGSGELLSVTLAPLKQTDSPLELKVSGLRIRDDSDAGEEELSCPPAEVTVAQDPSPEKLTAYREQAAALQPAGPLSGLLSGSWLPGLPGRPSPELAWLGLALAGLGLTAVAWALGKRAPDAATGEE